MHRFTFVVEKYDRLVHFKCILFVANLLKIPLFFGGWVEFALKTKLELIAQLILLVICVSVFVSCIARACIILNMRC